jgi:hypothetical protein
MGPKTGENGGSWADGFGEKCMMLRVGSGKIGPVSGGAIGVGRRFGRRVMWVVGMVGVVMAGVMATPAAAQDATWPTKPREKKEPERKKEPEKKEGEGGDGGAPARREETEKERLRREASGLFGPGSGGSGARREGDGEGMAEGGPTGWTVVLAVFRGPEREAASAVMLSRVQSEGGLPGAFRVRRGEAVVVAVGDFASPEEPAARAELERVQGMAFGGQRPYERAFLSPPVGQRKEGGFPQYNLARAKEMYGDKALYTLQIGAYGRRDLERPTEEDLKEAREAAEAAAFKLRQEGELAFYYHSTSMSMVTIGVFGLEDFDPQTPTYKSARLRDVQKRFPHNLYNGAGIKQRVRGMPERLQPSSLVALPRR